MTTAHEDEFARLEQFVEKLLESYNDLKAECNALKERLREKEKENESIHERISSLQDDRNVIHSRVSGLINKIEVWEKSFDSLERESASPMKEQEKDMAHEVEPQTLIMSAE